MVGEIVEQPWTWNTSPARFEILLANYSSFLNSLQNEQKIMIKTADLAQQPKKQRRRVLEANNTSSQTIQ